MKITVYGAGYVGLVTAVCFADKGHSVLCVDLDKSKIQRCQAGEVPIYEPGLENLLKETLKNNKIVFSNDVPSAVRFGDVHFIAVGTPSNEDGSADLQYVFACASQIGKYLDHDAIIVDKSTVPVGTAKKVSDLIQKELEERKSTIQADVVSNPEFLKEGAAIADFQKPSRVIVGGPEAARQKLWLLYQDFVSKDRFLEMDWASAELTKYASNALLATKISFMNELSHVAEKVGANVDFVKLGMALDERIGPHFINPGCGFGGSCFPKDLKALVATAESENCSAALLRAVIAVNEKQKTVLIQKLKKHLFDLKGKTIAIWGLSFKPETDDMREAPSLVLIKGLLAAGANVQAYDPIAIKEAETHFNLEPGLCFMTEKEAVLEGVDALVIVTEWAEFRNIALDYFLQWDIKLIIDGRNCYPLSYFAKTDIVYDAIGRPLALQRDLPETGRVSDTIVYELGGLNG